MAGFPVTGDQYRDIDRKILELKRQLNQKDGCPQDPENIKKGLQALIEGRFKAKPRRKIDYVFGMFAPVEIQVENIRKWNIRYGWDFTEGQISRAASSVPAWPMDTRFKALVLVPYLETVQGTFDALWTVAANVQKDNSRDRRLQSDKGSIRLLSGIKHPAKCLRWEIIDLAANRDNQNGISLADVRTPKNSPHAGILASAAHHPFWVKAMDEETVPFVWLPGYECAIGQTWCYSPEICFDVHCRRLMLCMGEVDRRSHYLAAPTLIPYEGCGY